MDGTIDPKAPPLSADELAKDLADSPHEADGPALKRAEDSAGRRGGAIDPSAVSDGGSADSQEDATDRSLTRLPPG